MLLTETILNFFSEISLQKAAILLFLIAYLSEFITSRIKKISVYVWKETVQNISIGALTFSADLLFSLCTLPLLQMIYDHRFHNFDNDALFSICLLFVLIDLGEYVFHLTCHKVNLLWAAHRVHHQSKTYNLSVGFRSSFFIPVFNIAVYVIFPFLGFSPEDIILIIFIQGIYQMFIHTTLIGKLGMLEYIFVTPSVHRVHHGSNEIYLDKNFGKVFVIWDRLFRTYEVEEAPVKYGVKNETTYTGIMKVILKPYVDMRKQLRKRDLPWLLIVFGKPLTASEDYRNKNGFRQNRFGSQLLVKAIIIVEFLQDKLRM